MTALRLREVCVDTVTRFLEDKGWLFVQIRGAVFRGIHIDRSCIGSRYYQLDAIVTSTALTFKFAYNNPDRVERFEYDGNDLGSLWEWYNEVEMKWGLRLL